MKRILIAVTAALAVVVPVAAPAAATSGAPARRERELHQALDGLVAAGAHGAILLDRHNGHTIRLASGLAELVPARAMRVTDRFRAASQMKSLTATMVLQLVQERRLGLDAPVDDLLPGVIPHGWGAGITVRHLLQHSSGLFDFGDDERLLAPYLAGDLGHVWTPQQLLHMAFEHEPLFPPGDHYSYSDTGYFLLAFIVEAVTGRTFGRELRERIIRPLGLHGTSLPRTTGIAGSHAHGYMTFGDPPADTDLTYMYPFSWAAGGLTTTADDSARFYRALMGGRLLSPAMMRELKRTIEAIGSDLPSRAGLGVQVWNRPCGPAWGKSGNVGGYLVYTWISPNTRHETVLMINEEPRTVGTPALRAYDALLDHSFCGGRR